MVGGPVWSGSSPVLLKWPLQRELGGPPKAGDGARLSQLRDVCYCGPVRLSLLLCMSSEEAFSPSRGL